MISGAAHKLDLNQGLAFGMSNLAWAAGQGIAAAAGGAIAQATTDFVPYALLAAACLGTLARHRHAGQAAHHPAAGPPATGGRPGRPARGTMSR